MYTTINFKTKKAFKEYVAREQKSFPGLESVGIYQPGPFNKGIVESGTYAVEGPHYPEPHKWYASVKVENFKVTSIK